MKVRIIFLLFIASRLAVGECRAGIDLVGRWISTEIDRKEADSIGSGWVISFQADGTFFEEIDEGFGVVEVWAGTFQLVDSALSLHRTGFNEAWDFSVAQKVDGLSIARKWAGRDLYVMHLKRSDAQHPDLAKLPRWPKTKAEAVAILKQKIGEKTLKEFAATPKDNLIGTYHFGLGMYIRNAFGIWRGNKDLWEDLTHGKPTHPDDLSGMIMEALWDDLQKK